MDDIVQLILKKNDENARRKLTRYGITYDSSCLYYDSVMLAFNTYVDKVIGIGSNFEIHNPMEEAEEYIRQCRIQGRKVEVFQSTSSFIRRIKELRRDEKRKHSMQV